MLIVSILLCVGTAYYVYENLTINTDTSQMLSPDLPFQKNQRRIDKAFPDDAATTLLVVESDTPEQTALAAIKSVELLKQEKKAFTSAYIPNENEFFRKNALLYLNQPESGCAGKKTHGCTTVHRTSGAKLFINGLIGHRVFSLESAR